MDCKTCKSATVLYIQEKIDRFGGNAYRPSGYVLCRGPRYKGRSFLNKDNKNSCRDYEKLEKRSNHR